MEDLIFGTATACTDALIPLFTVVVVLVFLRSMLFKGWENWYM